MTFTIPEAFSFLLGILVYRSPECYGVAPSQAGNDKILEVKWNFEGVQKPFESELMTRGPLWRLALGEVLG